LAAILSYSRAIASGLGSGYAPGAPGTAGSVLGLALGALILLAGGTLPLIAAIMAVSAPGIWSINALGLAQADPGWIVIDEIAGQMIAMLALTHVTIPGLIIAFLLFRAFDITKPGPIGWADAQHNAWGVMGDDWLAGAASCIILLLLHLVIRGAWL
jgi:phosphatidylglycerophosphatase A